MSAAAENHIADQIRRKKLELKFLRRRESADPDSIIVMLNEMETLLEKYNTLADGKYAEKNDDIAYDFCEEYFYELCKQTRNEVSIGKFYDLDATLIIVGKDKFVGKVDVIRSITDKFQGLDLIQKIESVTLDVSMTKGGSIHFECKSKLQINNDVPRKILQMFELVRSSLPTTYPYVIKKEYFIVQDARPLYHWPEKAIPVTKHDNWEPQFKPKVVERPKSATVAVVEVAPVEVVPDAIDNEDDDDEAADEEEGEEGAAENVEEVNADEEVDGALEGGDDNNIGEPAEGDTGQDGPDLGVEDVDQQADIAEDNQ